MNLRSARSRCIRCGTCCRKGGPCLHASDRTLVSEKGLRLNELITFRAGELAYDPYNRRVIVLPMEIIKIKSSEGDTACMFFEPANNSCSIYPRRPIECRELMCWDTSQVRALFLKQILSRKHILGDASSLLDLIESYDRTFAPQLILQLIAAGPGKAHVADLERMDEMDKRFRERVCERMGVPGEYLDFLFGRPVGELSMAFKRARRQNRNKKRGL